MKYACLVYHDEEQLRAVPDGDLDRMIGECMAYVGGLEESGQHVMSSGLQSPRTATTLRRRDGEISLTDGPFAETKEVLGGFTIIEARDLNEAIQIASKFPNAKFSSIEVRPLMDPSQEVSDPHDQRIVASLRRVIACSPVCQPVG
ncbi:MAG TPA: YciI family protein [Fimbriimonadaceae bacterium]|nr:YciI family protein [Fimbriimonadaceae bacterium]